MDENREASSGGSINAPEKLKEPEGSAQRTRPSGNHRSGEGFAADHAAGSDSAMECGPGYSAIESDGESPRSFFQSTDAPARVTDADSNQWSFHDDQVMRATVIDARRLFRMGGGTVSNTVDCGPAVILAFAGPRQVHRWEW